MGKNKVLLIIDMLNDFVKKGAPLYVPNIESIIDPIKREIEYARTNDIKIIYICDAHGKEDREFTLYPPHAIKNTKGSEIIKALKPGKDDIIIKKKTFSGFYNTSLDDVLKKLKITELIITGCVVNICVLFTVADAVLRGYKVNVIRDAVIGLNKKDYDFSLKQMKNILKVNIV